MNPYNRIALTVIRLVAAGCLLISIMNLGLYYLKSQKDRVPMHAGRFLWLAIPLVIGIVLLVKSTAIARRLTEDFDE
ncbi:hypothetical protein [Pedosphaera parvula]|jgi:hypothetical protein|uniref:Uncharacterized protein n=1 Tax=Pedosphaera parvula (strain Ellin514) TaxID=320771 RepID=B9XGY7_PEDPL|nr:hypothetical protein [Pedosphaera parvula]EEF60908.1 hypothetical protein Cflav_PD4077 [Pedosphaera parvula Ellin514]